MAGQHSCGGEVSARYPHLHPYQDVLKAALTGCAVLADEKYVNTDYKPANMLFSDIDADNITAKVGDLGLVFRTGTRRKAQPYAMRAPEVYLGQACAEPSQVWAVAAMLLVWIKPGFLGALDSPHFLIDDSWSMAKIKRLFPEWEIPAPEEVQGYIFKEMVKTARRMSLEEPEMQAISPLEEQIQRLQLPQQLRDLLCLMVVIDPSRRPSASSVLESREFLAFGKLAGGSTE